MTRAENDDQVEMTHVQESNTRCDMKQALDCWNRRLKNDKEKRHKRDCLHENHLDFQRKYNVVTFDKATVASGLSRDTNPTEDALIAKVHAEIVSFLDHRDYERVFEGMRVLEALHRCESVSQSMCCLTRIALRMFKERTGRQCYRLVLSKAIELNNSEKTIIAGWSEKDEPVAFVSSLSIAPIHGYVAYLSLIDKGVILPRTPESPEMEPQTDFELMVSEATDAFLNRDYRTALDKYLECELINPDDSRIRHNIQILEKRLGLSE